MTTNARNASFVKSHSRSGEGPVVVQALPALVRGGVERGTIEMARAIIEAGGKAVVISGGGPMVRHLDRLGAVHHTIPIGRKNPLAWSGLRRRVKKVLNDEGADILHVRSRVPAQIALPVAKSLGITSVSTVHGRFQNTNLIKRMFNGKMLAADHVIAISQYVRSQFERQFGDQGRKLTVVPRRLGVGPSCSSGPSVCPLAKLCANSCLSRATSTRVSLDSAFTTEIPTPCRPPLVA